MSMIGKTLAHYQIITEIGNGGMGEVFHADNTTLDRKVALKYLPDTFTGEPKEWGTYEIF